MERASVLLPWIPAYRKSEFETLTQCLNVIRDHGWLATFMRAECKLFDEKKRRTAADIVRSLAGDQSERFTADIETTNWC